MSNAEAVETFDAFIESEVFGDFQRYPKEEEAFECFNGVAISYDGEDHGRMLLP